LQRRSEETVQPIRRQGEEFSNLKSEPKERLKQLEDWLIKLPKIGFEYARYLRDIELHLTTIETNADNMVTGTNNLSFTASKKEIT
jgi:hypothetical protein